MTERSVKVAYDYGEVGFGSAKREDYFIDVQFIESDVVVDRRSFQRTNWQAALAEITKFIKDEVKETPMTSFVQIRNDIKAMTDDELWQIVRYSTVNTEYSTVRFSYARAELRERGYKTGT